MFFKKPVFVVIKEQHVRCDDGSTFNRVLKQYKCGYASVVVKIVYYLFSLSFSSFLSCLLTLLKKGPQKYISTNEMGKERIKKKQHTHLE